MCLGSDVWPSGLQTRRIPFIGIGGGALGGSVRMGRIFACFSCREGLGSEGWLPLRLDFRIARRESILRLLLTDIGRFVDFLRGTGLGGLGRTLCGL